MENRMNMTNEHPSIIHHLCCQPIVINHCQEEHRQATRGKKMNTSYLLSSALSPAHYALVHKVEQASSVDQLDLLCTNEIDLIRTRVNQRKKPLSESSARECLIFMLYIATVQPIARDATTKNLEFASILALNLAEGGKPASIRRAGYLYLNQTLKPKDDFSLLLFNTLIKDLRSSHIPTIVLALNSIIQNPNKDIIPAIQSQLTHLVSHKSPDIRRLSLCALTKLSEGTPDVLIGLKERKVWKRLEDRDTGVALHAVRALKRMIESSIVSEKAAIKALADCLAANIHRCKTGLSPSLQLEIVRTLGLFSNESFESHRDSLVKLLTESIETSDSQAHKKALILQICLLLHEIPGTNLSSMMELSETTPSSFFQSIQSALHSDQPDEYIFALRCFEALGTHISVWEGSLNEGAMEKIMNGLDHTDEFARKLTLKILSRLSPTLPELHLERLIASFSASESHSHLERLKIRSLEVLEIVVGVRMTRTEQGLRTAHLLWNILEGERNSEMTTTKYDKERRRVLETVVGRVLTLTSSADVEARDAFLGAIFTRSSEITPRSLTTQMILAILACEYIHDVSKELSVASMDVLTSCLTATSDEPVKEALLTSLLGLCVKLDISSEEDLNSLKTIVQETKSRSGNHLRKRCEAFLRIASSEKGFEGLKPFLGDNYRLPSILSASHDYISSLPVLSSSTSSSKSSFTPDQQVQGPSKDLSASELKYGPYPSVQDHTTEKSRRKRSDHTSATWKEDMDQTITIDRDVWTSRYRSEDHRSRSFEIEVLDGTLLIQAPAQPMLICYRVILDLFTIAWDDRIAQYLQRNKRLRTV